MNEQKPAKVVIHALEPQPMLERLKQRHPTVEAIGCSSYGQLPSCLKTFQPDIYYGIRFDGTAGFPRDALFGEFGPNWISIGGSGVDHLHHWDTERVQVTNASGVAASMMAEFMLGGFLHFNLDVEGLERDKAARVWQADRQMIPLSGKTLLIVGLGQTGCALAHRAKALGMHVIGTRARVKPTPDVDEVFTARQLNQVLPRADYIAVCVPLLSSTQDLIDKDAFKQMNADVVLADVSRGGVVNGQALLEALNSASIRGAILDVFETEPLPAEHLLWQAKNVLISPHCSSVFEGWEMASFDMFCENLDNYLTGEPLNNLIDPDLGY
jgi:phosphoglycerate dehydrogenase-like enzyme